MVWYPHLLKSFPQFIVIHTVKGFGVVDKAEIDIFLELSCFFDDPADVGNLISDSSAFSKSSLNIWKFMVHVLLKPVLEGALNLSFFTVQTRELQIRQVKFCPVPGENPKCEGNRPGKTLDKKPSLPGE